MENSRFKFRAWHDEHQEMVYFDNKKASNDIYIASNILKLMADNSPFLMQFTGLLDKNGVEIYEGDVLKCFGDIAKVVWDSNDALYRYVYNSGGERYMEILGTHSYEHFEVIGNIYEHHHLLEANHEI